MRHSCIPLRFSRGIRLHHSFSLKDRWAFAVVGQSRNYISGHGSRGAEDHSQPSFHSIWQQRQSAIGSGCSLHHHKRQCAMCLGWLDAGKLSNFQLRATEGEGSQGWFSQLGLRDSASSLCPFRPSSDSPCDGLLPQPFGANPSQTESPSRCSGRETPRWRSPFHSFIIPSFSVLGCRRSNRP